MENWHKVRIKVISRKGQCEAGHKVGDEYILGNTIPAGICSWAFCTLFPFISALQAGGVFPWEKDGETSVVACPDPDNSVVFELRRIREKKT
jgi:uncharacterized repeat protein (TIGR04076 family)